jgi:hypothetical protein
MLSVSCIGPSSARIMVKEETRDHAEYTLTIFEYVIRSSDGIDENKGMQHKL